MTDSIGRRGLLCAVGASLLVLAPLSRGLAHGGERRLRMRHVHTGEHVDVRYWRAGRYDKQGLRELDQHLRDWRQQETVPIDPRLYDLVHAIADRAGTRPDFEIICGYRSPATNAMLRAQGRGVARRSLHLIGKAIDLRLRGVPLARLRNIALSMRAGGVGYYPRSDFLHLDTGRVRQWVG